MEKNKSNSSKTNYFAEIIESSLDSFLAQCWNWNYFPEFGSLVQIKSTDTTHLGIVTQINTGSMDPMRYPFPYQKTEEELLQEQPQIFEFLKTTFKVQIVGYTSKANMQIHYLLPTKPCKIHGFVSRCPDTLSAHFFDKPDFLHILFEFSNQIPNINELLIAIIKQLSSKKQLTAKKLDLFCQTFSLLTGNDYRRLKMFLKRIEKMYIG